MTTETIDLRSDVKTLPTAEMLDAMRSAELGDSKAGEDPTVLRLEAMAAERLGTKSALLLISGTMANLAAIMALAEPGDGMVEDPEGHICYYEKSHARLSGVVPIPLPSRKGMMDPAELAALLDTRPDAKLLCLENTHNRSGGRVVPLPLWAELCRTARSRGLAVHVDGARIFNADVASGVHASAFAQHADSLTFCLSKSLGCPLGSVLCGSEAFVKKARSASRLLGGGMRQAGVIAAAGIVALESMVERLAEDHANARRLAEGLAGIPGLDVDMETVETNMVNATFAGSGRGLEEWIAAFAEGGVLVGAHPPDRLRFVTHRHHTQGTMDEALRRMRRAAG